ncbi:MAG: putative sigma-54 modulation protein [Acidimicrobiaceae bacterium]|jgi:ribosome-associated translation inhibitor RaiA|nr:putative sigma-54 modulation protein [Acidimicrobiaceae bacterium]
MEIAFRVRGVEVPESVRHRTRVRVTRLAEPCGIDRAVVSFSAERNVRITEREVCQIILFGTRQTLRGCATATDVAVAAERVVTILEQRARRVRGRQAGRRHPRWCLAPVPAAFRGDGWVHFPPNRSAARREPGAVDLMSTSAAEAVRHRSGDAGVRPMMPEEAALEMTDRGGDVFFFVNTETGKPAVVYQRTDGDIALYDAGAARAAPRWT